MACRRQWKNVRTSFFSAFSDDFQTAETGKLADAFSREKKAKVLQPK